MCASQKVKILPSILCHVNPGELSTDPLLPPPLFFHVVIEYPLRLIESTALIKAPFLSHLQRAV